MCSYLSSPCDLVSLQELLRHLIRGSQPIRAARRSAYSSSSSGIWQSKQVNEPSGLLGGICGAGVARSSVVLPLKRSDRAGARRTFTPGTLRSVVLSISSDRGASAWPAHPQESAVGRRSPSKTDHIVVFDRRNGEERAQLGKGLLVGALDFSRLQRRFRLPPTDQERPAQARIGQDLQVNKAGLAPSCRQQELTDEAQHLVDTAPQLKGRHRGVHRLHPFL